MSWFTQESEPFSHGSRDPNVEELKNQQRKGEDARIDGTLPLRVT
jgi:hypothetical protein